MMRITMIRMAGLVSLCFASFWTSTTEAQLSAPTARERFGSERKLHLPWRAQGTCASGATPAAGETPCDCQLAPEQDLFERTADELAHGSSDAAAEVTGPARQYGRCGVHTLLSDTLESGQILFPTNQGQKSIIPLFLSDKTKFYCVAIRPWTPCLLNSHRTANGIELTLSTDRKGSRVAKVFLPTDLDRRKITSTDDNFMILRRQVTYSMVAGGDVITDARKFANETACSGAPGSAKCVAARRWAVERRLLQLVRVERKPIGARTSEPDADFARLDNDVLSRLTTPAQRLLALAILKTELDYSPGGSGMIFSPYEIRDAGGPSGISLGHFQVDLATNPGRDKVPFRTALETLARATPDDVALQKIVGSQWLEHRVQTFSVDVLLSLYRSVRPFYLMARRDPTRQAIDGQLVDYAQRLSGCLGKLADYGPPFDQDPIARLYTLDVANHAGEKHLNILLQAASNKGQLEPADAMLKAMLETDYGKGHGNELRNRLKKIRAVVGGLPAAERNAVDRSNCAISKIQNGVNSPSL